MAAAAGDASSSGDDARKRMACGAKLGSGWRLVTVREF
jgi:hypothetical protein